MEWIKVDAIRSNLRRCVERISEESQPVTGSMYHWVVVQFYRFLSTLRASISRANLSDLR
jgi:hypothetical protein